MTNVQRLDHLNFTVSSFDDSSKWYSDLFGFEIIEEEVTDGVRWGVLKSGESMLCIYEHPNYKHLDRFQLADEKKHGMAHFALRIENPEAWLESARRLGVVILYDGAVEWPNSRSWYVNDPTGYEIEVVSWDDEKIRF
jgi:catechol 2,3-dioxygenase-like lactoylglutathione lyase family enzyme